MTVNAGISGDLPLGIGYSKVISPNGNLNANLVNAGGGWSASKVLGGLPIYPYANISIKFSPTFSTNGMTGWQTSESFGMMYQFSKGTYSSYDPTFTMGLSPSFGYGQGVDYYWDIGR